MKSAKSASVVSSANNVVSLLHDRAAHRDEREFLPAALEIVETPASPIGRAIGASLMVFFVIALAWSCIGHIDIIATAQGKVIPVGRVKVIQPLEMGMVTAIRVKDGDRVTEGQVLVELDRTVSTAERNRVRHDLLRAKLDIARLMALRASLDGREASGAFSPPLEAPAYEVARTRTAMTAQADQQVAKLASLGQQIAQKVAENEQITATIAKIDASLPLLEQTADVREKVMKMEYGNRLAHLEAQLKLTEQRHELIVQQRRAGESAAAQQALKWQREQAKAEYVRAITTELADIEPKAAQFAEDLIKAEKKLQDQTLRAPINGTVQQLTLSTIGGVVTAAQALMVVVPSGGSIEVEAMLPNKDIGFVHDGDAAEVKIDTFNFTKYGLIRGKVITVSHDAVVREKAATQVNAERQSGQSSRTSEPPGQELLFAARIALEESKIQIDDRLVDLAPGMAVTVEIKTGKRRIIEYLLSPLLRYKQESLRER